VSSGGRHDAGSAAGREGVWTLAAAPAAWALHFLACYVVAAVWCARAGRAAPLGEARTWIAVLTLLALALLGWLALRGWRRLRFQGGGRHDGDSEGDRHRFLGLVAVLLAALAALAVLYAAAVAAFVGSCA
jgi:hypothetical protein